MKKKVSYFMMLFFLGMFIYASSNEKIDSNDDSVLKKEIQTVDTDLNNPIMGYVSKEGTPVLTKDQEIILNHWNRNLSAEAGEDVQLNQIEFVMIDGDYYLRASSTITDYISTIGAFENQGSLYLTTTICTTKACSTSNGCIPSGTSCTFCIDCTKTVTSALEAPMVPIRIEPVFLAEYYIAKGWGEQIYWEYRR